MGEIVCWWIKLSDGGTEGGRKERGKEGGKEGRREGREWCVGGVPEVLAERSKASRAVISALGPHVLHKGKGTPVGHYKPMNVLLLGLAQVGQRSDRVPPALCRVLRRQRDVIAMAYRALDTPGVHQQDSGRLVGGEMVEELQSLRGVWRLCHTPWRHGGRMNRFVL